MKNVTIMITSCVESVAQSKSTRSRKPNLSTILRGHHMMGGRYVLGVKSKDYSQNPQQRVIKKKKEEEEEKDSIIYFLSLIVSSRRHGL